MSDLPKMREYDGQGYTVDAPWTCKTLADAMRDEFLARIGELEAERDSANRWYGIIKAAAAEDKKQAEAALAQEQLAHKILDAQRKKHREARIRAEAALAERDRMLDEGLTRIVQCEVRPMQVPRMHPAGFAVTRTVDGFVASEVLGIVHDLREILKAAGVECAEVEGYMSVLSTDACEECGMFFFESEQDFDAILALARLVAKYKWQRDHMGACGRRGNVGGSVHRRNRA